MNYNGNGVRRTTAKEKTEDPFKKPWNSTLKTNTKWHKFFFSGDSPKCVAVNDLPKDLQRAAGYDKKEDAAEYRSRLHQKK